jgi:ADP-ribosylglycohydrolase
MPRRIRRLLDAGIDCFIDLTSPEECPDYRPLLPAGVSYLSHPLIDHAVPDDPAAMRRILAALDAALAAGRSVYLHCRAGIGRTGMAIGCHLVEAGERGDAALETLNTLWMQDERAPRWRQVPETEEQARFVLGWRAPGSGGRDLADRAAGALLGLAVGDMQAAGTGQPGWTDDTAMALCVAESFIASRGFDARDQFERYRRWLKEGYCTPGGRAEGARPAVQRAIAMAGWRRGLVMGSHDPSRLDAEPLSRCIAPALYHHADLAAAVEAGAETARVTHQAPLVVDACRLFTGLLQRALAGEDRRAILAFAGRFPGPPLRPEVQALAATWAAGPAVVHKGRDSTILTVLDDVMRAFAAHTEFASGLRDVLARNADADVAAAAYGQIAGARVGADGIPAAWRAALPGQESLADLAGRLRTRS